MKSPKSNIFDNILVAMMIFGITLFVFAVIRIIANSNIDWGPTYEQAREIKNSTHSKECYAKSTKSVVLYDDFGWFKGCMVPRD